MDYPGLVPERNWQSREAGFQLTAVLDRGRDSGTELAADGRGPVCLSVLRLAKNSSIIGHHRILPVVLRRRDGIRRGLHAGASSHGGIGISRSSFVAKSPESVRNCRVFSGRRSAAGVVEICWAITTRNVSEGLSCSVLPVFP